MKVSVIIPTYNGAHKIGNVLTALAQQTTRAFEIVVVIDGSTDGTAAMLQSLSNQYPPLHIIEQANGGRAKVRNRGAAAANGDLLIFFDDDMRPNPDAVQQHINHHLAFPDSILTGGQIEEIVPEMPDFLRFKASLSRKWSLDLGNVALRPMTENEVYITAANFSVSKSTFESLNGFDERLTDAEDYDLAVRAFHRGIYLYANPSIIAWHDDSVTCCSYIRRLRQYALAHKNLAAMKPELYGSSTKYAPPQLSKLKKVFFTNFCSRKLIMAIEKNQFMWLPRSVRYKLYDYIITANGTFFPERIPL